MAPTLSPAVEPISSMPVQDDEKCEEALQEYFAKIAIADLKDTLVEQAKKDVATYCPHIPAKCSLALSALAAAEAAADTARGEAQDAWTKVLEHCHGVEPDPFDKALGNPNVALMAPSMVGLVHAGDLAPDVELSPLVPFLNVY